MMEAWLILTVFNLKYLKENKTDQKGFLLIESLNCRGK
jgi:hypothetical protein